MTRRIPNPLSVGEAEEVLSLFSITRMIDFDLLMVDRVDRAIGSEELTSGQSYRGIYVLNLFRTGA